MNTKGKAQEGQVLPDDKNNYTPLTTPMVEETARKTRVIIDDLHQGNHRHNDQEMASTKT